MPRISSSLPFLGLAALTACSLLLASATSPIHAADAPATATPFIYHRTDILGTSCDMTIIAPAKTDADTASQAAFAEIERLRKILSTYDPASELSAINAATSPVKVSPEVVDVLTAYDSWHLKTAGAHNGQLGSLIALWKQAEKNNALPTDAELAPIVKQLALPPWQIDALPAGGSAVKRLTSSTLNVDSLGKAYIIGKAVAAARAKVPAVTGLLLDIGGDIYAFGSPTGTAPWTISVADPKHPADNARPLAEIRVKNLAIGTSGNYARFYTINGKKYSHIFDPRTGKPADIDAIGPADSTTVIQSTVVATDNVTANALATSLCVLKAAEGLTLVRATPGANALIVTADGHVLKTDGFLPLESSVASLASLTPTRQPDTPTTTAPAPAPAANAWPKNFLLTTDIKILPPRRANARPFIYLWITDSSGNLVKTIAAWGGSGRDAKYIHDIVGWWKVAPHDPASLGAVTRATRTAGKYAFAWDGTDQKGAAVPTGTYTVNLEVAAENGPHAAKSVTIDCKAAPATAKLPASPAFDEANISYGPTN